MELQEKLAWVDIKNMLKIFSQNDNPIYLWDNLKAEGSKVLARLDILFYFSSST